MTTVEIQLTPDPQTFTVSLNGVDYTLTVTWRDAVFGGWFIDIADADNNQMISGIPLVTGADLLAQYAYLGIGGPLFVQTDHSPDAVPTFDNLGSASHLYFVPQ